MPKIGKEPPKEILLFQWGLNRTTKGPVYLTKEGAKEVIAAYEDDGRVLSFDLEHSTFNKDVRVSEKKACGYFRLSVKDDGLWATDIEWVPTVKEEVKRGEWGWFSPAVIRSAQGIIKKVLNVALTNLPATKNVQPLLLSSERTMDTMPSETLMTQVKPLKQMLESVGESLTAAQYAMEHGDGTIKEMAQKMSETLPDWVESLKKLLEEMDPEGLTSKEYSEDDFDKVQEKEKELEKEEEDLEKEEDKAVKGKKSELSQLHALCSEITGKKEIEEIRGRLRAMRQNEKVLLNQLSETKKSEVSLLVDIGIKEGKIPSAERSNFCALSAVEVKAYMESAMPLISQKEVKQKVEPVQKAAERIELNSTESIPEYVAKDLAHLKSLFA